MKLSIEFAYDDDKPGVVVDATDMLEQLMDEVQLRSVELKQAIIAFHASEDPPQRGQALIEVGANRDRGYILYTAPLTEKRPRDAWATYGERTGDDLPYAYQHDCYTGEVPVSTEIPFDQVKAAVLEFMETGERPTGVEWRKQA